MTPWVDISSPNLLYSKRYVYKIDYGTKKWKLEKILSPEDGNFFTPCFTQPLTFGNNKFLYVFDRGDRIVIYKIVNGEFLKRCVIIGGKWTGKNDDKKPTLKNGKWIWIDKNNNGIIENEEIEGKIYSKKNLFLPGGLFYVANNGNIFFSDRMQKGIVKLPCKGVNNGNPIYNWNDEEVVAFGGGLLLDFFPNQVSVDEEGNIYVLGWSKKMKNFKRTPFHCGGNVLCKFDKKKRRKWFLLLPSDSACMSICGNFLYVGRGFSGEIYQYTTEDGFFVDKISPKQFPVGDTGWLDHGRAVFVFTHPNGNTYIYVEEDKYGKVIRYKMEGVNLKVFKGEITVEK